MRIQIDLEKSGIEQLDKLKEATGVKTHKDLFNNAITLLDWAVKQRQQGRIVASMDETNENYKELQMPALEYAAEHSQAASKGMVGTI
jgi:hypothetical protein